MLLEKLNKVKCEVEPPKKWHLFLFHRPVANKHDKLLRFALPPFEANRHLDKSTYSSHFAHICIVVKNLVIFFVYIFE